MAIDRLRSALSREIAALRDEGRAKGPERVLVGQRAPEGRRGPRYRLLDSDTEFIRMNSNSYLSLAFHPALLQAADRACQAYGSGPGAVRFIDGTSAAHVELERRIARFVGREAARGFNSAYTAMLGLAAALTTPATYWIGDALNHNCIIRAMRFANVPGERRAIFAHNDVDDLERKLEAVPSQIERVVVIFDGIFSMRGDHAPLAAIAERVAGHSARFREGIVTVMDDSHGIGAYGATGRGTEEHTGADADVLIGTFGKAFGVNGGFVAAVPEVIEVLRQKADTYIYTNPLGAGDCAAAVQAVELADGPEGRVRLAALGARTLQFRQGLGKLGLESIPGPHPVVPLLVRDSERTRRLVQFLFDRGVLAVGLTHPVVPRGDETIRFQINAAHTEDDIATVLDALAAARASSSGG